jgi:hypothetical protein
MGIVVQDLDRAMDELGAALGYRWSDVRDMALDFVTPAGPGSLSARVVFTRQGPPWLEVIEGPRDSIWSAANGNALHHLGFFVDNLEAERQRLTELGMEFEVGGRGPDGRVTGFAYYKSPISGRIELVDERLRDSMERWITGGV